MNRSLAIPFAAAIALAPLPGGVCSAAEMEAVEVEIDKIVAVIEQQPILLSDLEIEARVALIQQGGTAAADVELLGHEVLARTLDHVINQRLVQREADRLQVLRLEDEARRQAYEDFVRRLGGEMSFQAFLARHEIGAPQIVSILERELRVTQFLANKVGLSARIAEADVREYFDAHPEHFQGSEFSAVKSAITAMLTRERVIALTRQFLDDLRARAELRILPPFAVAGAPLGSGGAAGVPSRPSARDAAAQSAQERAAPPGLR